MCIRDRCTTVCLAGGPCGEKSAYLDTLVRRLEEKGLQVFIAPEMPTMMSEAMHCGFPFQKGVPRSQQLFWEASKMQLQADVEDALMEVALHSGRESVILCDRGLPGSAAYMSGDDAQQRAEFESILEDKGWNVDKLMQRYDVVVHLETAAVDTDVYDLAKGNNSTRSESKAQAVQQDKRTQNAWAAHMNLKVIRNRECKDAALLEAGVSSFEQKKNRTVQTVFEHLGLVAPQLSSRGALYTMRHVPSSVLKENTSQYEQFEICQCFLVGAADRVLEKRGRPGAWSYQVTFALQSGVLRSERVSLKQYAEMMLQRDPDRVSVLKTRKVFVLESSHGINVTFRLEEYQDLGLELLLLDDEHAALPGFLHKYCIGAVPQEEHELYCLQNLAAGAVPPAGTAGVEHP
eukprot:TRINITY_DN18506_c0_g1_i4.p1 TRINITY_DN18506_c0_g1~~TRINITY_DN18506_c0_g1_i4.p1  ORF type:complete len:404 (+),score=142.39 TRINITY_DN18506_c0_g1_i4:140-1351(+)